MTLPSTIDPALWFTTKKHGPTRRFYFYTHNPHTFYGRMHAYDPEQEQAFCVSKVEIAESSRETEYFVKGFLAGNEPSPPEAPDGPLPDNDPKMEHWYRAVTLWHVTGTWKDGRTCEKCGRSMLPSAPAGFECEVCLGLSPA